MERSLSIPLFILVALAAGLGGLRWSSAVCRMRSWLGWVILTLFAAAAWLSVRMVLLMTRGIPLVNHWLDPCVWVCSLSWGRKYRDQREGVFFLAS